MAIGMRECDLQRRITDLCDLLHLRWYHNPDSRRSNAGFPDLVIVSPTATVFAELKTEKGKVTVPQAEWLDTLRASGERAYVWRPKDWPQIEALLKSMARVRVRA